LETAGSTSIWNSIETSGPGRLSNMWRTSLGERVLRGPEWDLFREGLSSLWDLVEDSDDEAGDLFDVGVKAFDRLLKNQKRALLAQVGAALKDEAAPCPESTSALEGTVAAVFRRIRDEVALEVGAVADGLCFEDDPEFWRRLVRSACDSTALDDHGEDGDVSLPEASSLDLEAWDALVDHLANQILWDDDDFEMEDEFLDADPEVRREMMAFLRIDEDYFAAVAHDPRDEETDRIRAALMMLCERFGPSAELSSSPPAR
jgi:hypothetical protein